MGRFLTAAFFLGLGSLAGWPASSRTAEIKSVEAVHLDSMRGADPRIQLLDVRESWEVRQAKIPGSVHIPLGKLEKKLGELDPQRPLIVYCRVGNRSASAAQLLQSRGFSEVWHLKGGIETYLSQP